MDEEEDDVPLVSILYAVTALYNSNVIRTDSNSNNCFTLLETKSLHGSVAFLGTFLVSLN